MRLLIVFMLVAVAVSIAKWVPESEELERIRRSSAVGEWEAGGDELKRTRRSKSNKKNKPQPKKGEGFELNQEVAAVEVATDPCVGVDCFNNGTCVNGSCSCLPGFSGPDCNQCVCSTSSCGPGEICAVQECVNEGKQCGAVKCAVGVKCVDNVCAGTACGIQDCDDGTNCQLSFCFGPGRQCGDERCPFVKDCIDKVCTVPSCGETYCVPAPNLGGGGK